MPFVRQIFLLPVVVWCYLSAISSICQISICLLSDSITMMTRNRKYISSEWNPCTNIWILNGILAHFQDEEESIWLLPVGCWSLDVGCWSLATVFLCGRVSEPPLRICCCLLYRVASAYLLLFPLSNFLLYFTLFSSLKMIISCREQISLPFLWHLVPVRLQIFICAKSVFPISIKALYGTNQFHLPPPAHCRVPNHQ